MWNTHDWTPVVTLAGQGTKLSSATVSKDTNYIITTSFDRTMKLWSRKSEDQKVNDEAQSEQPIEDVNMSAS